MLRAGGAYGVVVGALAIEVDTFEAWRAAGLGYLDDVIAPEDTRRVLIESLQLARGNRHGGIGEHRLAAWPTSF